MDKKTILERLKKEFPGKPIVELPLEIICETEPTNEHANWSEAIAYVKQSQPHYHNKIVETYTVEEGELSVVVDGRIRILQKGDEITIKPPTVHWAYGDWARIKVYTEPGWNEKDHILAK